MRSNEGEGEETQLVKPTKTSKLNESLFLKWTSTMIASFAVGYHEVSCIIHGKGSSVKALILNTSGKFI